MKSKRNKKIKKILILMLLFVLQIFTFSLVWCIQNFGNIGLNEIIFTINMPLKGADSNYFYSYFWKVLLPTLMIVIIEIVISCIPTTKKYKLCFGYKNSKIKIKLWPFHFSNYLLISVCIIWSLVLVYFADINFGVFDYVSNQIQASDFIEKTYVNPKDVSIEFPNNKRNLICIYIESAETSMQNKENGGLLDYNLIPEMTNIANENVSFSQTDRIEGAAVAPACGWTMAALVAQTSGLPLKLYTYDDNVVDNSMGKYASFLPGAVSLGDILQEYGYKNVFMAGSDFTFGGRREYFTQHGNYQIWDYNTAIEKGKIDANYKVKWGFEDKKLYEYAKEELLQLSSEGAPFNFSMLTVDTHNGGGYICELCENKYEDDYYNVWSCASKQLNDFVEWIKQQEFYDNTTIYISGDHCSMEKGFLGEYEYNKHDGGNVRKLPV